MTSPARLALPELRQRALALVAEVRALVEQMDLVRPQLPVSLYRTRGRCGKPSCHCADGPGHPGWALGYRDAHGLHTRSVSALQARAMQPQVEAYRRFRRQRAHLAKTAARLLKRVDRMQRLLLRRYRLPAPRRRRP